MKTLFVIDAKDYEEDWPVLKATTVRGIIRKDGLFAMQKNRFGVYKIPGGGPDEGETYEEALIREVKDEMGFILDPASIREIGMVFEKREDAFKKGKVFERCTRFYDCQILSETGETNMTKSEIALGFEPVWADMDTIIRENRLCLVEKWNIRDTEFFVWLKEQEEHV
jgi:ADP-ribose pyrophosphatase YjhB (NUDIX family)